MVSKKRMLLHGLLWLLAGLFVFPIYMAVVAASHPAGALLQSSMPLLPGKYLLKNSWHVLSQPLAASGGQPLWVLLSNSLVMAFVIAVGKVGAALLSAYALVFFRFRFQSLCFALIFLTLMLPVEVRILPTFSIAARLDLLNSYAGLTLPLIASATATFLFRQCFLTFPKEYLEAATMDGASPWRFFWDIIMPLSKTNTSAVFIIMFIYGWNQYLWPLVVTTESSMATIVMGINQLAGVADQIPKWHIVMTIAVIALLPPVLIVIFLQKLFTQGLVELEK